MSNPFGSLFLGPAAENAELVERFIVEALRDHVFWRRNFHPQDGPFILEADKRSEAFEASVGTLRQELYSLLSRLKQGAPFFSPRYIGHMTSDVTIASLTGYFAAMLYNPNNISEEGAPVTMELELEVGEQLARLVGYPVTAWGHLTSGGSVANLEALWAVRALKYFAPAAALVARELSLETDVACLDGRRRPLVALSAWELMNLGAEAILDLRDALLGDPEADPRVAELLGACSLGSQGVLGFAQLFEAAWGEPLPEPVILLPATKHYSWAKIANLLGIGQARLVEVPLDADYRTDPVAFEALLASLRAERVPVLAFVAVLGATETGAVDGLHRLLRATGRAAGEGLAVYCHVDAAYGGYATAMFRTPEGAWTTKTPCAPEVSASFLALPGTDSLTVDPHKLGYAHYPAGAIVFRDRRVRELLTTPAPYVFDPAGPGPLAIGNYIVEGSKPGAAAAAVWLNHRVTPLDTSGYGALIGSTVRSAQALHAALAAFTSPDGYRLVPLHEPDLNLVTFLAVPPGASSLAELNRFNEALYRRFATGGERLVFSYEFVLSKTVFDTGKYGAGLGARLPVELLSLLAEGSGLTVLRSSVMNPFAASDAFLAELLKVLDTEMRRTAKEQGLGTAVT